MPTRYLAVIAALSVATPSTLSARPRNDTQRALQSVTFEDENDWWGKWSDKYYTNGMRLAWTTPDWFSDEDSPATRRMHFSLSQEMNTPKDTNAVNPPANDHPYSGLTYVGVGFSYERDTSLWIVETRLGIIGPGSGAEGTQRLWHKIIGDNFPKGWDHQLPDEFAGNIALEHRRRLLLTGEHDSGFATDLIARGSLAGGNIRTQALVGAQWRFGYNLPADYGRTDIRNNAAYAHPRIAEKTAVYGYLDLQGELVGFNYALDGTVFRDSPSVKTNPWVGQVTLGITAEWHRWRLSLFQSLRSKEFHGQDRAFVFGGMVASFAF